jgi:hypothetical protein
MTECVYILNADGTKHYKIGQTTNIDAKIKQLQSESSQIFVLEGLYPCDNSNDVEIVILEEFIENIVREDNELFKFNKKTLSACKQRILECINNQNNNLEIVKHIYGSGIPTLANCDYLRLTGSDDDDEDDANDILHLYQNSLNETNLLKEYILKLEIEEEEEKEKINRYKNKINRYKELLIQYNIPL